MIAWALFGIIVIYLAICVGIGFLRGLSRSRVRTISILVSAVAALITTVIMKSNLGNAAEIEEAIRSSGALDAETMKTISSLFGISTTLNEAVIGIFAALVMPIVFFVLFVLISLVMWLVCTILTIIFKKKYKEHDSRARQKPLRIILLSVANGLIVMFVLLVPINVYTQLVPPVTNAVLQADVEGDIDDLTELVDGYIDPLSDSALMSTFRVLGGNPVSRAVTNFRVNGNKVRINDEIQGISELAGNVLSLGNVDMKDFDKKQADTIKAIAGSFEKSSLLPIIVGEVIYGATDAWLTDEQFIGVERPAVGELIDPTFNTMLNVLRTDARNLALLRADIHTVADVVIVFTEYDVFSKMDDNDALISQLGADGMVKELITVLGENESMKVLIVEIRNMGMRAIAQSLDIPANGEVVYNQFLNEIADALNDTQGMGEEERLDALTQKVKDAFNEANVPIEEDIIDCYSASLIYDLGSIENITSDDISDFFTAYANHVDSGNAGGLEPISTNSNGFRGDIYGSMSEEELAKTGASVLASVTVSLSNVQGDEQAVLAASAVILQQSYATLYEEGTPAMQKISQIEVKVALDKSAVENTAGMQDSATMNSGVVTLDQLLADVEEVAKSINAETLLSEAEALNNVFQDLSGFISDDASFESIDDIIDVLGPVLDSLQTSVSVGEDGTANLLVATMQSKTVREKTNMDMNSATNLAIKATSAQDGEKVDYEKTLNSVAGIVEIGNAIGSGENASEEDIRKMIENLTPQTSAVLREYVTEERMKGYGIPEENAYTGSQLLVNLFDYLASDLPEDQFDHEAHALQQLINIAITAKEEESTVTRLFGEDGALGKSAYDMVSVVVESDAICHSLDVTLTQGDETISDPFGVGKHIPQDSVDKQEFDEAVEAYRAANPSEETNRRLELVAMLFGV